jgi:hypothetical protein
MVHAAIALAIFGLAVGVVFRLKVLFPILVLLLVVSILFSLFRGSSFLEAALTIMAAQSIVQGGYFLGLIARALFAAVHRTRPIV